MKHEVWLIIIVVSLAFKLYKLTGNLLKGTYIAPSSAKILDRGARRHHYSATKGDRLSYSYFRLLSLFGFTYRLKMKSLIYQAMSYARVKTFKSIFISSIILGYDTERSLHQLSE